MINSIFVCTWICLWVVKERKAFPPFFLCGHSSGLSLGLGIGDAVMQIILVELNYLVSGVRSVTAIYEHN